MIMTTIPKPTKQALTGYQTRATLCIDLGNDAVKALLQLPGSDQWERVQFPSRVQQVSAADSNSSCIRLSGGNVYLVGNEASVNSRTGTTRTGKVDNAQLLTLHAIRLLTGFTINPFNTNIVFTTPSNRQFGTEVIDKLQRSHYITVPADPGVIGSKEMSLCVIVHKAISQLEGYQSHSLVLDKLKGSDAWLLDIGGGTVIATQFNAAGRILQRAAHNESGVHALANRLLSTEALANYLPKLPTIAEITSFLFMTKDTAAQAVIVQHLREVIAPALSAIPSGAQVFLCGGGAGIKGASAIGKPVSRSPQWANIESIAAVSTPILEAK